jgi:hypothetical protein
VERDDFLPGEGGPTAFNRDTANPSVLHMDQKQTTFSFTAHMEDEHLTHDWQFPSIDLLGQRKKTKHGLLTFQR